MVKVLFEGSIFLHQNLGGISKYIVKLNDSLKNNNVNSKIFCPITISHYLNRKKKNNFFFLKLNKIPKFFTRFFFYFNNFLTIIYVNYYKPDMIHFSYYNNFLAKYLKIPYVLTVYDLIHEEKKYSKNFFDKKKSIENAKHIVCISKKTKKDLIKFYKVDKKKISVIYLGAEIPTKSKIKKKNYILFVGSRQRYKNFINFVKAYGRSNFLKRNYDILCFGGGNFTLDEIKLFEDLNIINKIKFKDGNDLELKRSYIKASLFVSTSTSEGFGLTPFEAMSFGCPVVCSNIEVFRENLKNCSQLVNPKKIDNIKSGIEKVLRNKSIQQKLINRGFKKIKKFTWKATALQTYKIYKDILK